MSDAAKAELRPGDMEQLPGAWRRAKSGNCFHETTLRSQDERYDTAAITVFKGRPGTRNEGRYGWVLDGSFSRHTFETEEEAVMDASETHGAVFPEEIYEPDEDA